MATPPKIIGSHAVFQALAETGLFDLSSGDRVRRVVIDLQGHEPPIVHVDFWGDERLLKVARTLEGIEISRE